MPISNKSAMDGDGQSMLAIVQSLRDAGLVVTVVDGKHSNHGATAFLAISTNCRPPVRRPLEHRSMGINTKFKSSYHSSTQANDARYASVYQLSHCGLEPTSPPVHLPEFPPQRATPHLTEGNFEVRGWRNSACQYTPVRSSHSCKSNLHWHNRGSVYQHADDTSAFAHSLRKYPKLSPNRSLSTELVQRLLTYTQIKNLSKSSYNTNNERASETPIPKPECVEKTSKNVQTYTRTKNERIDKGINTTHSIKCQSKLSCTPDKSRHSLKDKPQNYTYDYLKKCKPRGWNSRGTEVRYLTDVTRCIKDVIRNICDETPVMCPRVQSRYSQHRRLHHPSNGHPSTSINNDGNINEPSTTGSGICGIPRCPSPNNVCPRIQTRYNQHKGIPVMQKSCSNLSHMEIQACPPPVVREASVMTKCESAVSMTHVCKAPVKTCCFCKKPLPCHCKLEMDRKIEKEVLEWMKEIPVYSDDTADNKCLRNMLASRLGETLQKIIKDGELGKIREEIEKCINVLPMWCPENEQDKTALKNQIAENLMNRLKQFTEKDLIRDQILSWFEELPFKDKIKPEDKDKFIDNLINRLKAVEKLPNSEDYKRALKNEIVRALSEIPGIAKDDIERLAEKLADKLVYKNNKKEMAWDTKIHKIICEWIDNRPEFIENGFVTKDNVQLIDNLAKTVTEHQKEADEGKIKETLKSQIEKWIENVLKSIDTILDTHTRSTMSQDLINRLYPRTQGFHKYVPLIFEWLRSIPELSHCLDDKKGVDQLAKELLQMQKEGYDDEHLLDAVVNWINNLNKKYGIYTKPEIVKQFAQKLIDKLKLRERKPIKLVENFKETISEGMSHILKDITVSDKIKKNLQKKMTVIMSNTVENVLSNDTAKAKKDLMELLTHESNMTPQEAEDLATTVIDSTKAMPLTKDLKSGLNRGIEEISANSMEDSVSDLLPDEIIRGKDTQSVRNEVYPFLEESSTPDERLDNIERARKMSVPPYDRSSIAKQRRSSILSPSRDTLKQNIKQKVYDFIEEELVPHSSMTAEDMKTEAKDFINKLPQLLQKDDFEEYVHQEIIDYLNRHHISSDKTKKELADKLAHKLLRPKFESSTPRKEKIQPRRLTFDSSMPSVHFPDESKLENFPGTEERYTKDLSRIVKNWLDKIPISLNDEDSVRYKDTVINDLVADIIDRQKYLQLNPSVMTSDAEELENLKYQVFRWLNKLMNPSDIEVIMPQTEAIIQSVREIPVPQLGIPSGGRRDEKQALGQITQPEDALQDEISLWVDRIPTHMRQLTDHNQMIRELAQNIQHADSKSMDDEIKKWLLKNFKFSNQDDINKVAHDLKSKLARKGFSKEASWILEQDSGEFIEENLQGGILDWMKKSPYYQAASAQDKNTIEKVVAGMAKGMKNVFESAFNTTKDEDTNKLFIYEIVKHMKKVPMDPKNRSEEVDLINTASELLRYLKQLQMFQNISDRRIDGETSFETKKYSMGFADVLDENLTEFIESLPIKKGKFTREREEAVKHNITNKLRYVIGELNMNPEILKDDFLYNNILEDELDSLISALPLDVATEDSVDTVKKSFINKIKKAKETARNQIAGHIYKQQLRDTISKTLPPSEDLSYDEQASLELLKERLADAFINLHFNGANGEISNKYKNKINNEISKFCDDYLKRHPLTPIDSRKLNNNLYEMLKNVTVSSENEVRDEVEETKIKDLIIDCANELPLKQDTQAEKLQAYKILTLMSKRVHKLDKDKESIENYENVLKGEITKWTKKLPLKHRREENINDFANNLVNELKRSKNSRSLDIRTTDTIPPTDIEMPRIPPSTLSQPDRDHLEQIRERTASRKSRSMSPIRTNTSISSTPIDAGSQTEVRPWEKAAIPKTPSSEAATSVEPHVCLSPTCSLRRTQPCVESERTFCHIKPESCSREQNWSRQGHTERLLSCDYFPTETGSRDLKSPSCECQPQYIQYKFSPTHSRPMQRSCTPRPRTPNVFQFPQKNIPNDTFPTPKRCKRKDQSPPRQEQRPQKTIRSRAARPRRTNDVQGICPELDTHEHGLRNSPKMNCRNHSKRELLISDDEFEDYDRNEKLKCDCKERAPSCRPVKFRGPCKDECIKRCLKCCGVCPHPTNLFFRN